MRQNLSTKEIFLLNKELVSTEKEIARLTKSIKIGETLTDLRKDKRYQEVFDEYYLKDEIIRESLLLTDTYFMDDKQRQSIQDGLIAKSHFNDWVNANSSMGTLAKGSLQVKRARKVEIDRLLSDGYVEVSTSEVLPPEGVANDK